MCDRPMLGYKLLSGVVVLAKPIDYPGAGMVLPCGKCVTCRLRLRGEWIARGRCEAAVHALEGLGSYFSTLTFSDEHLPRDLNISKAVYRLFVKRMRHEFGAGLRYQGIGEYGGQTLRPHYHFSFFGLNLTDLVEYRKGGFRSETIERLWPFGQVDIVPATPQTIGYVAGHQLKDLTGANTPDSEYLLVDPFTGELRLRVKPFRSQSNRPGIGEAWFRRYWRDVVRPMVGKPDVGWIVLDGEPEMAPHYFLRLLRGVDRAAFDRLTANREALALSEYTQSENMPDRRAVRSSVRDGRLLMKRRPGQVWGSSDSVLLVDLEAAREASSESHG